MQAAARVAKNRNRFQPHAGQAVDFGWSSTRRFEALPLSLHSAHVPFRPTLRQRL
jgi:hypothetical protein